MSEVAIDHGVHVALPVIRRAPKPRAWQPAAYRLGGVIAALVCWQWFASSSELLSRLGGGFAPANTASALIDFVRSGGLTTHALPSLFRVSVGLLLAVSIGIPIGVLVGRFAPLSLATDAVFQFIRMTSPLAWMPLAILLLGVGAKPVFFLVAIAAVWPIIINTAHGVRTIPTAWLQVVRMLGGGQLDTIRFAIVPAIVPDMLTGVRIAIGVSWLVLVPAEMLGVSSGMGYFLLDTRDRFAYDELMAGILVVGSMGFVSDLLIRMLYRRYSWRPDRETEGLDK